MLAVALVFGVLVFYHDMLLGENEVMKTVIWNIPVMVVLAGFNLLFYLKNKAASYYKVILTVEVAIQFMFYMFTTDATFLGLLLIGVLAVLIPYYEKKSYWIIFSSYMVLFAAGQILRQILGAEE